MARLIGEVPLAATSVSAGTTYTLWQGVAPSNQRLSVSAFYVGMNYNTNGTPGLLSFGFAGAAGTGGTSVTPVSVEQDATETFQSTWSTMLSSAPTTLKVLRNEYINPQVSVPEYLPLYEEFIVKGGGIFYVQFVPQVSGNVSGWLRFSE